MSVTVKYDVWHSDTMRLTPGAIQRTVIILVICPRDNISALAVDTQERSVSSGLWQAANCFLSHRGRLKLTFTAHSAFAVGIIVLL